MTPESTAARPIPPPTTTSACSTLSVDKTTRSESKKENKLFLSYLVLDLEAGSGRGAAGDDTALEQLRTVFFCFFFM